MTQPSDLYNIMGYIYIKYDGNLWVFSSILETPKSPNLIILLSSKNIFLKIKKKLILSIKKKHLIVIYFGFMSL